MKALLKNAQVYANGEIKKADMLLDGASLSVFSGELSCVDFPILNNTAIFPGFCDLHVHFREPGFSYKETIATGSRAAARGGYTAVCTMPNLKPAPDTREHISLQLDIARRSSVIPIYPYATITAGEEGQRLSDMDALAELAIGFSDDGRGVQSEAIMLEAMQSAHRLGKIIAAHCEDNSLLRGGYIHDGEYAHAFGHLGICSESEYVQVARDLELAERTGCSYHVCHVSTKESVELIRRAKARGVDVTCETAPHYLLLCDKDLREDGSFKMNPPLRSEADRLALIDGIKDGTIDVIATDHAPHSAEEKSRGLKDSLMGIVGIETAFPTLYTHLVLEGVIPLCRLVELLSVAPRARFGIGGDVGFTVFDLSEEYEIDPCEFLSMGKSTPFKGMRVRAKCLTTVVDGRVAYNDESLCRANKKQSED